MTINTEFTYLSTILDPSPDLWEICEDPTIDWKGLAEQNIVNYNEIFNYDGMLYCLSLLHQKLFFDRQQIRKEDVVPKQPEPPKKLTLWQRIKVLMG